MANKKFFWLKLKEDFFRDKRIKKLRRIAGGDTYTIIYLKLQLLSLKHNGALIYEGIEPTLEEELALEIDEDDDNVKVALAFMFQNGLIEETDPNHFIMTETIQCIGSESANAERVRKHRELKAKKQQALQCNTPVTISNIEIEKEEELEEDLEQEIEIEPKPQTPNGLTGGANADILSFEETAFNKFWSEYPKKVNKKGCFTSFKRIKNLKFEFPLIMEALENFKNSKQWQKDNGQYIPNPQTFINQERWKDEQQETREQQLQTIDMTWWI